MTQHLSRTTANIIRRGLAMPTSCAFPLDWNPEPADLNDLEANLIEAAAYLMRHRHGSLKANATLSGLTAYTPAGACQPLGAMGADKLEALVAKLRDTAARQRKTTV